MKFVIDEIEVSFPYRYMYPEQLKYMRSVLELMKGEKKVGLFELPVASGKRMCLFAACMSYFVHAKKQVKITLGTKSDLEYMEVME